LVKYTIAEFVGVLPDFTGTPMTTVTDRLAGLFVPVTSETAPASVMLRTFDPGTMPSVIVTEVPGR